MIAEDLLEILRRRPFRPLRLHMSDGTTYDIRHPETYVRPREAVFRTDYVASANQEALGRRLVAEYAIRKLTSCNTCHR